ncbi:MAG: hypothetical protein H6704_12650 [Myxococcales bacterium]|nr:hypothetical protein [Myxococcales bacterium]
MPGAGGAPGMGGEPGAGGAPGMGGEPGMGGGGGTVDIPPNPDCAPYCGYLEMCESCLEDDAGECLDTDGCVAVCDAQVPDAAAACIAGLNACDEDAFLACYDDNIGDDDCANACRVLEDCGECFTDDEGECLSLAGCALVCRDVTPPAAAACIATAPECAALDACFQ